MEETPVCLPGPSAGRNDAEPFQSCIISAGEHVRGDAESCRTEAEGSWYHWILSGFCFVPPAARWLREVAGRQFLMRFILLGLFFPIAGPKLVCSERLAAASVILLYLAVEFCAMLSPSLFPFVLMIPYNSPVCSQHFAARDSSSAWHLSLGFCCST